MHENLADRRKCSHKRVSIVTFAGGSLQVENRQAVRSASSTTGHQQMHVDHSTIQYHGRMAAVQVSPLRVILGTTRCAFTQARRFRVSSVHVHDGSDGAFLTANAGVPPWDGAPPPCHLLPQRHLLVLLPLGQAPFAVVSASPHVPGRPAHCHYRRIGTEQGSFSAQEGESSERVWPAGDHARG